MPLAKAMLETGTHTDLEMSRCTRTKNTCPFWVAAVFVIATVAAIAVANGAVETGAQGRPFELAHAHRLMEEETNGSELDMLESQNKALGISELAMKVSQKEQEDESQVAMVNPLTANAELHKSMLVWNLLLVLQITIMIIFVLVLASFIFGIRTPNGHNSPQEVQLFTFVAEDVPTEEDMMKGFKPYEELFENNRPDNIIPELGYYRTKIRGQRMGTYKWKAVREKKFLGTVVLVHGFGDHLGRYNHVANFFCKRGYDVCGIDHKSHGRSQGFNKSEGTIMSHKELSDNLKDYITDEVRPRGGSQFIYSHSTGGMVTFLAFDGVKGLAETWEECKGVVYSAPLIRQPDRKAKPLYCCPWFFKPLFECFRTFEMSGIEGSQVSNHHALMKASESDPYSFGGKVNLSIIRTLLTGTVEVSSNLKNPTYPFFVMQSPEDTLVDPEYSFKLYIQAASKNKEFHVNKFAGFKHSLHNHQTLWKTPLELAAGWFETLPETLPE